MDEEARLNAQLALEKAVKFLANDDCESAIRMSEKAKRMFAE